MYEELQILERSLLDPVFRHSRERVEPLIADDFFEIGSSGRTFDKQAVVEFLVNEPDTIASRTMSGFRALALAENVVLVTFALDQTRRDGIPAPSSLRSSIWRHENGRWLLLFHQGTPTTATTA